MGRHCAVPLQWVGCVIYNLTLTRISSSLLVNSVSLLLARFVFISVDLFRLSFLSVALLCALCLSASCLVCNSADYGRLLRYLLLALSSITVITDTDTEANPSPHLNQLL